MKGAERSVPAGTPYAALLAKTASGAGAVAVKTQRGLRDLSSPAEGGDSIEPVFFDSPEGKEVFRHSSAHLMAQAVKSLFPRAKLAIGPAIEEGFYYDFAFERPFTPEDLEQIEKRMVELTRQDIPIVRTEMPREEAITYFRERDEPYKVEILKDIPDPIVSLYRQGDFVDLCQGPHVPSTGRITALKILSSAGAYWRGEETNPMLQRIYGISFPDPALLLAHLARLEEIKKRDHRKIGRELDLFSVSEEVGGGLILWHPRGAIIRKTIEDFWREEHLRAGYEIVYTPHLAKLDLWKKSGHLDYYRENMYAPIEVEGKPYEIKPMNCPLHIQIYKSRMRSYRDLPFRWAELGTVYRFERSGVLHGLLRVRGFTQDDAHLFCRPDQIEEEIVGVLDFTVSVLKTFGFEEYEVFLSTRPDKFVGTIREWEDATAALKSALERKGLKYSVDPGGGVFYGPKIDMKIRDALGRAWQCSTVQVDFNLPQRFQMGYIGEDGKEHRPIMIHRALLGSIERFFGVLIEHFAGAFPLWLSPIQAIVLAITDRQHRYAQDLISRFSGLGIRAQADLRSEKIGAKIREAQLAKIPYMLVIGDREEKNGTVAVRLRSGQDLGEKPIDTLLSELIRELKTKSQRSLLSSQN